MRLIRRMLGIPDFVEPSADTSYRLSTDELARPVTHPACTCGCRYFTAGGSVVAPACDGRKGWLDPAGGVLSCLRCAKRWAHTPDGLMEVHADSMPPAWTMQDMQREAAKVREERKEDRGNHVPKRPIEREFRRPPRPV